LPGSYLRHTTSDPGIPLRTKTSKAARR
jgi:hypothetical protein